MELKIILGAVAALLALVSSYLYIRDIFRGRTKPHFFSWFIWGLVMGIVFLAQVTSKAGPGAWVTGFSAVICLIIAVLALKKERREIKKIDWACFIGALIGIILWIKSDNPLSAVILVTIVDAVAFIPTFRKSYNKPYEETVAQYVLASLKWIIGLFAIESLTLVTWLYPVSVILSNGLFVLMVLIRRNLAR